MSADLIARLIEAGTPAALVADVAIALGRADHLLQAESDREARVEARAQHVRDLAAARQRKHRSEAASRMSRVTIVTGRDERDADPSSDKRNPQTPKKINSTPGVCVALACEDPITVPVSARLAGVQLALAAVVAWAAAERLKPDFPAILAAWNDMAARTGLPKVGKLTEERRKRIGARCAEHGRDAFTEAIAAVERSSFCRGDSSRGWRADFDFLLQPSSFNRLLEGSYDRHDQSRDGAGFAARAASGPRSRSTIAARDRVLARMAGS